MGYSRRRRNTPGLIARSSVCFACAYASGRVRSCDMRGGGNNAPSCLLPALRLFSFAVGRRTWQVSPHA